MVKGFSIGYHISVTLGVAMCGALEKIEWTVAKYWVGVFWLLCDQGFSSGRKSVVNSFVYVSMCASPNETGKKTVPIQIKLIYHWEVLINLLFVSLNTLLFWMAQQLILFGWTFSNNSFNSQCMQHIATKNWEKVLTPMN